MTNAVLQIALGCLFFFCACPSTGAAGQGSVLDDAARKSIEGLVDEIEGIPRKRFSVLKFWEEAYLLYYSHAQEFPLDKYSPEEIEQHIALAQLDDEGKPIPRIDSNKFTTVGVNSDGGNAGNGIGALFLRWILGGQIAIWMDRESTDEEIKIEMKMKWEVDIDQILQKEKANTPLTPDEEKKKGTGYLEPDYNAINAEKQRKSDQISEVAGLYRRLLEIMERRGVPIYRRTETKSTKIYETVLDEDKAFFTKNKGKGIQSVLSGRGGAGQEGAPLYPKAYRPADIVIHLHTTEGAIKWAADISSFLKTLLSDTGKILSNTLKTKLVEDQKHIIVADHTTAINGFFREQELEFIEQNLNRKIPKYNVGMSKAVEQHLQSKFSHLAKFSRSHKTYVISYTELLKTKIESKKGAAFFSDFDLLKDLHTGCFTIETYEYTKPAETK